MIKLISTVQAFKYLTRSATPVHSQAFENLNVFKNRAARLLPVVIHHPRHDDEDDALLFGLLHFAGV